ncbi:MAG: hypothetical protein DDT40_01173 [candidate division WS2 bacterium]|nr:hypothetical protein [Candidatus Psychracetigena formicireducens]
MTEYVFDLQSIMDVSEKLPYTIDEGIERSIRWMKEERGM